MRLRARRMRPHVSDFTSPRPGPRNSTARSIRIPSNTTSSANMRGKPASVLRLMVFVFTRCARRPPRTLSTTRRISPRSRNGLGTQMYRRHGSMTGAKPGRKTVRRFESGIKGGQLLEQRLSLFQIGSIKPFGEPTVDLGQHLSGLLLLSLLLPQPSHARHGSQLK